MAKIEATSLAVRRTILTALIESDGRHCLELSRTLRARGIDVGATSLARFWKDTQRRLQRRDLILTELVKDILSEQLQKAKEADVSGIGSAPAPGDRKC